MPRPGGLGWAEPIVLPIPPKPPPPPPPKTLNYHEGFRRMFLVVQWIVLTLVIAVGWFTKPQSDAPGHIFGVLAIATGTYLATVLIRKILGWIYRGFIGLPY